MTTTALTSEVRTMLSAAVSAPSVLNTQPWKFRAFPDRIDLHADPDRLLTVSDPRGRQQVLSCGAALYNMTTAVRHLGREPTVIVEPDSTQPTLLARLRWDRPHIPTHSENALFAVIGLRHTARRPYADQRLRVETVAHLEEEAADEGGLLRVLPLGEARAFLDLARRADEHLRMDPRVRAEFAAWVGSPRTSGDGLPDEALGTVDLRDSPAIRDFALGAAVPGRETGVSEPTPNIAVISTYGDARADWLRAGAATQRVLLQITRLGMVASFLTQPLEEEGLRSWVRRGGTFPQIALRVGYGPTGVATPRRPLEDVLL